MEQTQIESFKMVEQYDGKNASVYLEINKCPTHMTIMDRLKQDFPLKRKRKTKKSIKKNNIKKTKTKIKKIKLQLLTDEDENKKLNNKIYTPLPKNLTIKI
jgi:hypothetical protein